VSFDIWIVWISGVNKAGAARGEKSLHLTDRTIFEYTATFSRARAREALPLVEAAKSLKTTM
jgi:hypothetical protein